MEESSIVVVVVGVDGVVRQGRVHVYKRDVMNPNGNISLFGG